MAPEEQNLRLTSDSACRYTHRCRYTHSCMHTHIPDPENLMYRNRADDFSKAAWSRDQLATEV